MTEEPANRSRRRYESPHTICGSSGSANTWRKQTPSADPEIRRSVGEPV
jgi:hypothetical protein